MKNKERIDDILSFWFGDESNVLPSASRTELWFGSKPETDAEIRKKFAADVQKASQGEYDEWFLEPRGTLALIILLDQFPRHIFRNTAKAYDYDQKALDFCLQGVQKEFDHAISLIERVFFYFPLMHAESLEMQATSVRAYQILVNLAFPETRNVYENFLDYAIKHYEIIRRFGRFPYRNSLLGRVSTAEEIEFLKTPGSSFGSPPL